MGGGGGAYQRGGRGDGGGGGMGGGRGIAIWGGIHMGRDKYTMVGRDAWGGVGKYGGE